MSFANSLEQVVMSFERNERIETATLVDAIPDAIRDQDVSIGRKIMRTDQEPVIVDDKLTSVAILSRIIALDSETTDPTNYAVPTVYIPGSIGPAALMLTFIEWDGGKGTHTGLIRKAFSIDQLKEQTTDIDVELLTMPPKGDFLSPAEEGHHFDTLRAAGNAIPAIGYLATSATNLRMGKNTLTQSPAQFQQEVMWILDQ